MKYETHADIMATLMLEQATRLEHKRKWALGKLISAPVMYLPAKSTAVIATRAAHFFGLAVRSGYSTWQRWASDG